MLKTIRDMLIGALVIGLASAGIAAVGTPPGTGFQLIDGAWLNGMAGGSNYTYQAGITAKASGLQSTCVNLSPNIYLLQADTVATTGDSVCLPFAIAGQNFSLRNNGAQTLGIYAQPGTNLQTATTDTINNTSNTTEYTLSAQNSVECFVAKNGSYSCVRGN